MTRLISKEKCLCGHPSCKDWWLVGIGKFVQGSGFDDQEAEYIIHLVNTHRVGYVASTLSESQKDLLLGRCPGWGSWMYEAGENMVSKGLGTKANGSIQFDTPLAEAVRNYFRSQEHARKIPPAQR